MTKDQTPSREEVIRWAREAGLPSDELYHPNLERFFQAAYAAGAAAKDAEHKEAMRWDIHSCGPTCKRYACLATREAVEAEREACAKVCDATANNPNEWAYERCTAEELAAAIRARKENT